MVARLVLATTNCGKVAEMRALLGEKVEVISLADAGFAVDLEEDGPTFEANARKKAEIASVLTGHFSLADDSGLEVDALGGAPGVRSARYAGEPSSGHRDLANNEKLLYELKNVPAPRCARFRCALAFARPGRPTIVEQASCEGEILDAPSGPGGFGYDPLFFVPSLGKTMAELPPDVKNAISHRGQALAKMVLHPEWLRV